jgi:eukaryotic-like serine/threonine-protein kinase
VNQSFGDRRTSPDSSHRIAQIVEEIIQRLEEGEPVSWESYYQRYPQHAAQLQELQPAMQALVDLTASGMPLAGADSAQATPSPARRALGDFRLVREIGRGGMGIVYEAEQVSLGRRVALKVLPMAGLLDPRQLQRFKNEARAAASLNHPHIVPVYSVGTEHAVHFYSMQLIQGETLAAYLPQITQHHELPPTNEARHETSALPGVEHEPSQVTAGWASATSTGLPAASADTAELVAALTQGSLRSSGYFRKIAELGSQIADALDYAHSLGIVHRDVKPSNLLVDDQGKVWIADFGLAQLESETGITMTGDLLGTLRYMSPEQALGQRGQVDGRTDIYSLGITLYELLAGRPAFSGSNRQLLLRQVIEQEPPPLRQINPSVPRDLETIVLKAIAKEPLQRYSTSQTLAEDLRRFLNYQPVHAKRPTVWDRSNKWLRRHPALVTSTMLVLLTMALALGVSTLLISAAYENEAELRQLAENAVQREQRQREAAEAAETREAEQRRIAESEAKLAKAVKEFLQQDVLQLADPATQLLLSSGVRYAADLSLREVVLRASEKIDDQFPDQPRVEAEIRSSLAAALNGMGEDAAALPHRERVVLLSEGALETEHPETLFDAWHGLVFCLHQLERYEEAHTLAKETLEIARRRLGPDHRRTLAAMSNLAAISLELDRIDESRSISESLLPILQAKLGPDDSLTLVCQHTLADAYQKQGRIVKAGEYFEQCYSLARGRFGPEHPVTINMMASYASHQYAIGQYKEARRVLTQLVAISREKLGPLHVSSLLAQMNLASAQLEAGQVADAFALLEPLVAQFSDRFGSDHHRTLECINVLGHAYLRLEEFDKALPIFEKSHETAMVRYGVKHDVMLQLSGGLSLTYFAQGQYGKALSICLENLDAVRSRFGAAHPETLRLMMDTAAVYAAIGQIDKALPIVEEACELADPILGPSHRLTIKIKKFLGKLYQELGELDKALPLLETVLDRNRNTAGAETPETIVNMADVADVYLKRKEAEKAFPMLEEALRLARSGLGTKHAETTKIMVKLANAYLEMGRFAEAPPLLEHAHAQHVELFGTDHRETLVTRLILGTAYVEIGQHEKALLLLEPTLAQLQKSYGPDHSHTLICMKELGFLFWSLRRLDQSIPMFAELLRVQEAKLGRQHVDTQVTVFNLGINYKDASRLEEAIPLLEETLEYNNQPNILIMVRHALLETYAKTGRVDQFRVLAQTEVEAYRKNSSGKPPTLVNVLVAISEQYLHLGLFEEAIPLLRECLQIRQRESPDTWNFFNTQSRLGAALMGHAKLVENAEQKKSILEEAEQLMIAGYEGMKQRESTIPPAGKFRVYQGLDRLIELYSLLEKSEQVETYRQLRSTYPPASEIAKP